MNGLSKITILVLTVSHFALASRKVTSAPIIWQREITPEISNTPPYNWLAIQMTAVVANITSIAQTVTLTGTLQNANWAPAGGGGNGAVYLTDPALQAGIPAGTVAGSAFTGSPISLTQGPYSISGNGSKTVQWTIYYMGPASTSTSLSAYIIGGAFLIGVSVSENSGAVTASYTTASLAVSGESVSLPSNTPVAATTSHLWLKLLNDTFMVPINGTLLNGRPF